MKNNNNKKIFALIGFITVGAVIVLAVFMARQRQDIRQRAEGDSVSFTINPSALPAGVTGDFDATLVLQGNGNRISAVDVTITSSDRDKLVIGRFTPSSTFTTVTASTRTNETQARYVGLNMSIPPVAVVGSGPSGEITLGTLRLRNIGSGGGSLSVDSTSKVTSGRRLLSITNTHSLATYAIAATATTAPPAAPTDSPSVASATCEYSAGSPSATNFRINGSNFGNGIGDGSTRHVYLYTYTKERAASLGPIMGCDGWSNNCISGQFFPPLPSGTNHLRIEVDGVSLTTPCNSGTPAATSAPAPGSTGGGPNGGVMNAPQ